MSSENLECDVFVNWTLRLFKAIIFDTLSWDLSMAVVICFSLEVLWVSIMFGQECSFTDSWTWTTFPADCNLAFILGLFVLLMVMVFESIVHFVCIKLVKHVSWGGRCFASGRIYSDRAGSFLRMTRSARGQVSDLHLFSHLL